jgi:hypothetical protein
MKILTYAASLNDDAPEHLRCCARLIMPDGKLAAVVCHAPTKTEAREKMQAWWDGEMERERKRRESNERRADRMRQARSKPQPQPAE